MEKQKIKFISNNKDKFSVLTKEHGKVHFSSLRVWQEELISKHLEKPNKIPAKNIVKLLAKCSLVQIDKKLYTLEYYEENPENFDKLTLKLNDNELSEFANKFVEVNSYLFGQNSAEVSFGDNPPIPWPDDKDLLNTKWPENIFEKIKLAWLIHNEKQKKWAKNIFGLTNISTNIGLASVISKQSKVFSNIFGYQPSSVSGASDLALKAVKEEKSNLSKVTDDLAKHQGLVDSSIIKLPNLLEDLLNLQKDIYKSSIEISKFTNQHLQEQIKIANKNGKNTNRFSISALFIALTSLIISAYQICGSKDTVNIHQKILSEIKKLNYHNDTQKNTIIKKNKLKKRLHSKPILN